MVRNDPAGRSVWTSNLAILRLHVTPQTAMTFAQLLCDQRFLPLHLKIPRSRHSVGSALCPSRWLAFSILVVHSLEFCVDRSVADD